MRLICDRCGRFDAWTIDIEKKEGNMRVKATCECKNTKTVIIKVIEQIL